MATTTAPKPAAGGSSQVPVPLGRWIVFGVVVVVAVAILAVIYLGFVPGLQLHFTDWWTEFAVAVAALTVVLFLVTIVVVLIAGQSPKPTPFGTLAVQDRGVTVHVIPRSGDVSQPLDHSFKQAKTWTVDSAGNLTVWSPDGAEATFPFGSWELVEKKP